VPCGLSCTLSRCRGCPNDFQCHPGIEANSNANITMIVAAPRAMSASSGLPMRHFRLLMPGIRMRYVTTVTGPHFFVGLSTGLRRIT